MMDLSYEEMANGIRLVRLMGELDIRGTGAVETRVAGYSAVDGAGPQKNSEQRLRVFLYR